MEMRSHKSSTPQVFFNAEPVGGLASLLAQQQEGELEAVVEVIPGGGSPGPSHRSSFLLTSTNWSSFSSFLSFLLPPVSPFLCLPFQ